ncbi:helix-turn-helix domain-containing protein [Pedobacter sp. SD-b]|uniref:Helix-turn-helix domain-containing protein n=1 Tax=Pedobacter segetis TaxID=2793069 RepID=A0ABS1BFR7_9SPHI|nr:helix-turn-helix domain-containing protein [Pedobacter segetis]MBK0381704.1 helix-turn-helix domain-containing protein [Pedobacter segetis]
METPILIEELKDYPFDHITRLNCEDDMLKFKATVLGESSTALIPMTTGILLAYYAGKPEKTYQLRYSQYYQNKVLISLMLSGNATHKLQESIDADIHKNQSFMYAVKEDGKLSLVEYQKAKRFEMASLIFDEEVFLACLDKFFDKDQKKEKAACLKAIYSGKKPGKLFDISNDVNLIIKQILKCRLKKNFRRVYLECKVYELLAHYFQSISCTNQYEIHFSSEDVKKLQQIKTDLGSMEVTDVSIDHLCKKYGLNRFKLTSGFQSLFNISVVKFYRKKVLQRAFLDIKENKLGVTEAALKYGYNTPQSFSKAFYKEFDIRPSAIVA